MSGMRGMSGMREGFGLDAFYDQASARIRIRHVLHHGEPFYSVIDVVGLLTDAKIPRNYWSDLKRRLAEEEGFAELRAKIVQLKMEAPDGKQRLTDAADTETLLRIIQSIPSPKAEPFKQWLAKVGHERLQKMERPALAADRLRQDYRRLGYSDEWITWRLQGIVTRDELTDEWREREAKEGKQFAALTDTIHRGTFDVSDAARKAIKHLAVGGTQNPRDSMTTMELLLTALAEETAKELHQVHDSQGFAELRDDAGEAGEVGGAARRDIEARTGRPVMSGENDKMLRQGRQRELQDPPFGADGDEDAAGGK
jgi:DNA-damage-inducible protein D